MRRGFWFIAGAGAGVYVLTRARRAAELFTPEGLRDRLGALDVGARMFREEYAEAQAEKETELRERYGLLPHGGLGTRSLRSGGSTTEHALPGKDK